MWHGYAWFKKASDRWASPPSAEVASAASCQIRFFFGEAKNILHSDVDFHLLPQSFSLQAFFLSHSFLLQGFRASALFSLFLPLLQEFTTLFVNHLGLLLQNASPSCQQFSQKLHVVSRKLKLIAPFFARLCSQIFWAVLVLVLHGHMLPLSKMHVPFT